MSKIDSKARGPGKRGGILSSFLASPAGRSEESQDDESQESVRDRARLERDQWPEGAPESANDSDAFFAGDREDGDRSASDRRKGGKGRRGTRPSKPHERDAQALSGEDEGGEDEDGTNNRPGEESGDRDDETAESEGRDVAVASDSNRLPSLEDDEVYTRNFSDVANARLWRRTKEARKRAKESPRGFRDVFGPTRPKRRAAEFMGRRALIGSIIEAIEEECAHVVLCGETGLGKTSLANVIAEFARDSGYLVARITGTEDLNFGRFIRTLFEELFHQIDETPAGRMLWETLGIQDMNELLQDSAMDLVSEFLGEESLDVTRVIRALDRLSDNQAIVVIDDYDQITNRELKVRLVQVMKALSDQGGWLSFLIMGRGESPSELLQDDIDSLPNAEGLYVDPLALHEIEEVLHEGAQKIGVQFNNDTVQAIARLSQGVPNVLQWLAFLSVRRAVRRKSEVVEIEDLANIVNDAVTKIDARLRNQYDQACRYEKGNSNSDLLYLAVRAPCTPSGLFSAQTMHVLSRQIVGRKWKESEIHTALLPLCGKGEKSILRKLDTSEGTFYRFAHPAMRAVVMLKKIVRIPLLSDMRTKDVDAAYLPSPEQAAATSAAAALSHATHAPAQGTAETPQDALIIDGEAVGDGEERGVGDLDQGDLDHGDLDQGDLDREDLATAVEDAGTLDHDPQDAEFSDVVDVGEDGVDLVARADDGDADTDEEVSAEATKSADIESADIENADDDAEAGLVLHPDREDDGEVGVLPVDTEAETSDDPASDHRRLWLDDEDDDDGLRDGDDVEAVSKEASFQEAHGSLGLADSDGETRADDDSRTDEDREDKDRDGSGWDVLDLSKSDLADPDHEAADDEAAGNVAEVVSDEEDTDPAARHDADRHDADTDADKMDGHKADGDDEDTIIKALTLSEFEVVDALTDTDEPDAKSSDTDQIVSDASLDRKFGNEDFPPQPLPFLPSRKSKGKASKAKAGLFAKGTEAKNEPSDKGLPDKDSAEAYEADPVYADGEDPLERAIDLSEIDELDTSGEDGADTEKSDTDTAPSSGTAPSGETGQDDPDLAAAELDWESWPEEEDATKAGDDPQSHHIADAMTRELTSQADPEPDDFEDDDFAEDETETRRRR